MPGSVSRWITAPLPMQRSAVPWRWLAKLIAPAMVLISCLIPGLPAARAEEPARPPHALAVADPIHDDLEALAARGIIELPDLFARPLLRHDVALALARAYANDEKLGRDPVFRRALRAFASELDLHLTRGLEMEPPSRPLFELRDDSSWLRAEVFAGANAEAAPDRGFVLTDSTRLGVRLSWIIWPGLHLFQELYAADIDSGRTFGDPLKPGTDIIIFQDRVYAALHTRYADIVAGRDRLAWGPGTTGSLLLSKTARPFTQLRLSRSFFDGLFHAVIVNGVLSRAEGRYIAYHRLDWRASSRLRFGFAEGARYNADGLEPLYLIGIIPYPVVSRILLRDSEAEQTRGEVRDNIMWSLDATWQIDRRLRLYGELLIDDIGIEADDHPTRIGYQAGALWIVNLLGRECRARFEWTRVWNYVYSTFYGADFVNEGVSLGYPYGPDSRVAHLGTDWILDRDWTLTGIAERVDRGEGELGEAWDPANPDPREDPSSLSGVVETQWRVTAGFRYAPTARLEALVDLGPAWVKNANHEPGRDRRGLTGRLSLAYRY